MEVEVFVIKTEDTETKLNNNQKRSVNELTEKEQSKLAKAKENAQNLERKLRKAQAEADPEPQASEQLSTDVPSEDSVDSGREETAMSDSMQDETLVQDETLAENQKDLQAE